MEIVGAFAAAPDDAEDFGAARKCAVDDSSTSARAALMPAQSRRDPSRTAWRPFRDLVLGRQGREQREADQRLRGGRTVSTDGECALAFAAADGLGGELDCGGAGGAGGSRQG